MVILGHKIQSILEKVYNIEIESLSLPFLVNNCTSTVWVRLDE